MYENDFNYCEVSDAYSQLINILKNFEKTRL